MKRLQSAILVAILAAVGYFALQHAQKAGWKIAVPGIPSATSTTPPPPRASDTVRVATWNLRVFGEAKLDDPQAIQGIVAVLRNFDVIAIQEVRAVSQDAVPRLVELLNAGGQRHYDYALGPRLGRTSSKEQYAFVFDLSAIEIDRYQLYTIDDRDDQLHREPLVGWFRCRAAPPEQAFTFSLVNVHTDPDETDIELDVLDDVFYAVRDDGRQEDDVIMLGDFNVRADRMRQLGQVAGLVQIVTGQTPTNVRHNAQYDNILFHQAATTEYTGRSGVYDFLRDFNLTQEEAERISDHLPVWAEFSVFEGGRAAPLARRPSATQTR